MFCLNLCELIGPGTNAEQVAGLVRRVGDATGQMPGRVYAGSYFCARYFTGSGFWKAVAPVCAELGVPVTLVVPVANQGLLEQAKRTLREAVDGLGGLADEVTVNDVGMLGHVQGAYDCRVNLGRLFFRDPRDVRVPRQRQRETSPALLQRIDGGRYLGHPLQCVELDQTSLRLTLPPAGQLGCEVALHGPVVYMSTGMVCKFGSLHREVTRKFRPNGACGMECLRVAERTHGIFNGTDVDLLRVGRTIYAVPKEPCETSRPVERTVYFPLAEAVRMAGEEATVR